MPPKKSRSLRGRGGRGGRASTATAGSGEDLQTEAEAPSTEDPSSVISPPDALPTESISTQAPSNFSILHTTQHQDDDPHFLSPNTSPTNIPTETPAPTPARPPVQRLDSLGLSGRGGGAGGGVGGRVMAGKFKPKAVTRRSLADRVQLQLEEEELRRQQEIEAQKERDVNSYGGMQGILHGGSRNWEKGGMRGRGRGRGEVMGRRRPDRNTKAQREASGLFGIAPAASAKRPVMAPPRTSTTRARSASESMDVDAQSTTSSLNTGFSRLNTKSTKLNTSPSSARVKQDPDTLVTSKIDGADGLDHAAQSAKIKVELPDPIYPEEQEEGSRPAPRVDIEHINLVTDDEDDYSDAVHSSRRKGKGRTIPSKSGLKPVRLQREEHKERVTMVNTEPAATILIDDAKEPTAFQTYVSSDDEDENQAEVLRETDQWSGVWQDDVREAKHDPGVSEDAMDVDVIAGPTTLKKVPRISTEQVDDGKDSTAPASAEKDKTNRRRRPKQTQPIIQTEEDRAEHERYLEDLRILAEELGGVQVSSMNEEDGGPNELDEPSMPGQSRVKDLEGRLYLFQFPPALPTLINKIKKEEAADGGPDLMEVDAGASSAKETIDLTKPDPEEVVTFEASHGPFQAPPEIVTEEGFVGKLVVRRSGKVQLEWGGILLELGRGVQSDYLTTTMIFEGLGDGGSSDASAKPIGTGTGMGKVMGNFVLKPDFEAMGLM